MRQRANIAEGRQKKEEKAERSTETWEIGERFFFLVGSKKRKRWKSSYYHQGGFGVKGRSGRPEGQTAAAAKYKKNERKKER